MQQPPGALSACGMGRLLAPTRSRLEELLTATDWLWRLWLYLFRRTTANKTFLIKRHDGLFQPLFVEPLS